MAEIALACSLLALAISILAAARTGGDHPQDRLPGTGSVQPGVVYMKLPPGVEKPKPEPY